MLPILHQFKTVTLNDINKVRLLNRLDTKYLLSTNKLPELLKEIKSSYYIVVIENQRFSSYKTVYFDTEQFEMFTQHQNGKFNRYKIRKRTYVDSNLSFLEVKFKNNKKRTIKQRIKIKNTVNIDFVKKHSPYEYSNLSEKIDICYKRMTFVDKDFTERLTIDTDLQFKKNETAHLIPGLSILELKQDKSNKKSNIQSVLKKMKIFPESVSKYCLGISMHYNNVKKNHYKEKLRYIKKIVR